MHYFSSPLSLYGRSAQVFLNVSSKHKKTEALINLIYIPHSDPYMTLKGNIMTMNGFAFFDKAAAFHTSLALIHFVTNKVESSKIKIKIQRNKEEILTIFVK